VKKSRPVNLDLTTIKLPLSAVTSILHRISGLVIFVAMFYLLYLLDKSLASEEGFTEIKQIIQVPFYKLLLWMIISAFIYHFIAGIKHLFMDIGIGENKKSGFAGSCITIGLSGFIIILCGIWLW